MAFFRPVAFFGAAFLGTAFSCAASELHGTGTSFFEPFNRLDLENRWFASDGWTNGSYQGCHWQAKNLSVSDGRLFLSIENAKDDENASCAEIQSRDTFGHGTYEISMRPVAASGTVSAFFTYIGAVHELPHDEIDFEFLGKDPREIQLNFFVDGEGGRESFVPAGRPDADGFVRLAFEWTQERIRWFVDGKVVRETAPGEELPANASKIYLSFWNGTDEIVGWLGPYDEGSEPARMAVEWVAFTALGDTCRFPASVTCDTTTE